MITGRKRSGGEVKIVLGECGPCRPRRRDSCISRPIVARVTSSPIVSHHMPSFIITWHCSRLRGGLVLMECRWCGIIEAATLSASFIHQAGSCSSLHVRQVNASSETVSWVETITAGSICHGPCNSASGETAGQVGAVVANSWRHIHGSSASSETAGQVGFVITNSWGHIPRRSASSKAVGQIESGPIGSGRHILIPKWHTRLEGKLRHKITILESLGCRIIPATKITLAMTSLLVRLST
mmetsp:Transcript_28035/g.58448  ORF Transcript_28035/g.58448 Transcript_28035/m.58448 type:complete len:240 (-) Transcript_28035:907-1626(-)